MINHADTKSAGGVALRVRTPAVNVTPIIGADFLRGEAKRLNGVDRSERELDLPPAKGPEQDLSARLDAKDRGARLSVIAGAENVDAGNTRAMLIGRPAHEAEYGAGREADDAPPAIDSLVRDRGSEANLAHSVGALGKLAPNQGAQHLCDALIPLARDGFDAALKLRREVDGHSRGEHIGVGNSTTLIAGRANQGFGLDCARPNAAKGLDGAHRAHLVFGASRGRRIDSRVANLAGSRGIFRATACGQHLALSSQRPQSFLLAR